MGRPVNGDRKRVVPGCVYKIASNVALTQWRRADAPVKMTLSLSTSPAELDPASEEPFHVVLTAHNPGDKAITFYTHITPFLGVEWGGFENFTCTTLPDKVIDIWPRNWPHWVWDSENLPLGAMLTAPAHGSVSEKLEVPRAAIDAANVKSGEHYRTSLVRELNGCKWWTYGTLQDLEGTRLRMHQEEDPYDDPDSLMPEEWLETYGDGPWTTGMLPGLLCMVRGEELEFRVK